MENKVSKIVALLLVCCMVFSFAACGNESSTAKVDNAGGIMSVLDDFVNKTPIDADNIKKDDSVILNDADDNTPQNIINNIVDTNLQLGAEVNGTSEEKKDETPLTTVDNVSVSSPKGKYNEGVVLVKFENGFDSSAFGDLKYTSVEALYSGSKWYSVMLADSSATEEAVTYLTELDTFEKVDYDYVMGVTADTSSVDVSSNPYYDKHKHHHTHKIPDGWKHIKENGKHPGGSSDVVVAVIDTGVDYNHLDLRNNIWTNTAEIAGNGKDDDGNGYIDDVYGWDCVGNDKDPMDDNGHGTHVAGIIASENNEIGGVGVAYGCKIMVLKAGNSSGHFNNSDIAEAIQYAYMNGASVINMSFGGTSISIAVEEALENAYNTCVLVAAAGNNGACNQPGCPAHFNAVAFYPAALPYVIGVMSVNLDGSAVSSFSNYDHNPYNSIEYEVYAVGESIHSTWPGNRYTTLNGTSMAAPTVSAIAALLRSAYPDRNTYSTKFIQSQIVNTGTINPYNYFAQRTDSAHSVTNVYEALIRIPKPEVNLYGYSIDDSASINANNNGNGVIDAGETVRLYVSLHNRGGVAENVNVTIDAEISEGLTDPYFTFVNDTIQLSDIGTYSVRESGDKYFEIIVSPDCPNDYLADFNIHFTYTNGMDENDNVNYSGYGTAYFNVSRGFHLPATITEDTTYTADKLYIVGDDVIITEGVTVTFEEGCEIQFYDDREYYNSPQIIVYGTLNFEGTAENMVKLAPDNLHTQFRCCILNLGTVNISYTDAVNLSIYDSTSSYVTTGTHIADSYLRTENFGYICKYKDGTISEKTSGGLYLFVESLKHCYLDFYYSSTNIVCDDISDSIVVGAAKNLYLKIRKSATSNIFYTHSYGSSVNSGPGFVFGATRTYANVKNNVFCTSDNSVTSLLKHKIDSNTGAGVIYENNNFSKCYQTYASQAITGYYDSTGNPTVDVYGALSDASLLWPYVVSVEIFNADGEPITTIGREEIKVRVTFNRPMDTTKDTYLSFGTIEPYSDYRIDGEYVSDTVWEGAYTLKAQIENGQNFLKVNNACAAEDQTKTVFSKYQPYEFTIDTTAAMAMNLQAVAKEEGIELTFAQDDYDTLLGYNIYRSTEKDGNFVKLNPAILLPDENVFLDENAEPGKTYWYTYTVVLSDFTESNPAGKVMATAMDTMSPSLYHTPVNQGYENNNLVISCTASDNVAISNVTLYYRAVGTTEWETLSMVKTNDKYSATIFGSDVTLAGIEYYIVATDGRNTVDKGSQETPYTIVVKSADSLTKMGDVDGNGTISTKDALMLMQCINGDLLLSDDEFKRADLNGDGVLSSVEALRILQYINGKVTTLEM